MSFLIVLFKHCSFAVPLFALFLDITLSLIIFSEIALFLSYRTNRNQDINFLKEILIKCCILNYGNYICRVGTNTYNFIFEKEKNETNKTSAFTFHCEGSAVISILMQYL